MKKTTLSIVILFLFASATLAQTPLLYDVALEENAEVIQFFNDKVSLHFNRNDGSWQFFGYAKGAENLITPNPEIPETDFKFQDEWALENAESVFKGYDFSISPEADKVHLNFHYQLTLRQGKDSLLLTKTYTLYPGQAVAERSASVTNISTNKGKYPPQLEDFLFHIPGFVMGSPEQCVVDVPGPWFPHSYIAPSTPYKSFSEREIRHMHGAPDASFGVLTISNPAQNLTMVTWMDTGGETKYTPGIRYQDNRLQLFFSNNRAYFLRPHQTASSDIQHIELVNGTVNDALERYHAFCAATYPLDTVNPDWVKEMILLEIYPDYYKNGFTEITEKLPFYKEIGFNSIYLMPHWLGGYSPLVFYAIEEQYGTEEELKKLIETAHNLGMKVFFDMVIHGFNENSDVVEAAPELFVMDTAGNATRHRTWKSMSTDWNAQAYLDYMRDLAKYHIQEFNIDGYRLDAASYKGPGWDPKVPYPAYKSGSNAPEVIEAMLSELRKVKPDAMILNEVFGPVFYAVSNLSHDNQTEAPQQFLNMMKEGKVNIEDYKTYMQRTFIMLPKGANRVFFARNHDTSWFYHFDGYTPEFLNLDAIHGLCTIPEVFTGDNSGNKGSANPDDDPRVWEFYKKLYKVRQVFPQLSQGELLFEEVKVDNDHVFSVIRKKGDQVFLILISFLDQPVSINASIDASFGSSSKNLQAYDMMTEKFIPLKSVKNIEIKPYQTLIIPVN